jgi:hypothetical protein
MSEIYSPAKASGSCVPQAYCRDPTLPFWRSNIDADALFEAHAHSPDRAHAWLRYRNVNETCPGFRQAVMMLGHFEAGILNDHTYRWTFTPGCRGDLAVTVPIREDCRVIDFVAMSRHDHTVWGCVTGAGQYIGSLTSSPLRVHRSPAHWLANDCDGVLLLSKYFYPQLRNAPKLVAEDDDHAFELSERVFIEPALEFGCDASQAEDQSFEQIEVAE